MAKEVIFTSGATEAINQTLRMLALEHPGGHMVTSQLEHKAVLASCEYLESLGIEVTYLAPNHLGEITPEAVQAALKKNSFLVALMRVNNETGVRTPIPAISSLAHEAGVLVFCDAVQAFGFESLNVADLGVDFMALSAHKCYGPKGVGALYVRQGLSLNPFILGGEQERGMRAGTHNMASIVGMGAAAQLASESLVNDEQDLKLLKDAFEARLKSIEGVSINAEGASRGCKHSNVRVNGVDGEALLVNLDTLGVAASAGSACAAGSLEPSHVLTAMGLSPEQAKASIRFSLGRGISQDKLTVAFERFKEAVERCRLYAL
jgi:cysteine desulfurase